MDLSKYNEYTKQNLSNSTQLKLFTILDDVTNNTYYLNIFRSYIINMSSLNDTSFYELYEVDNNDWFDNISYKFYNTPQLWWVICMVNNIINPFEELQPGQILRILKNSYIYNILKEVRNIGNA
jgi:hypothetical protein